MDYSTDYELAFLDLYFEYLLTIGDVMNYSLHRLFFIITAVVSLALLTSPSYAKDEGDKKPKTTKVKKAKKDKVKKETSKKKEKKTTDKKEKSTRSESSKRDSNSDSGSESNKSGEKAAKPSRDSDRADRKGSDDSKDKGDKDSKSSKSNDSGSSNKSGNKKSNSGSRSGSTTSKAKKQYKDIIVNLNKADAKTFSHYLVGIGEKRAKAIVAYRKKNGKFKDIKELLKVEGIGDKIFDRLKKNVSLSKGETSAPKGDKPAPKKPKK